MKKYKNTSWLNPRAPRTVAYVFPDGCTNLMSMDKHEVEAKIDSVPEWRLFLARQILRNRISLVMCEAIVQKGMSLDEVGAVLGKSGKEIAWFLRPESIDVDAIADVCYVLGVDPVLICEDRCGLPSVTAEILP